MCPAELDAVSKFMLMRNEDSIFTDNRLFSFYVMHEQCVHVHHRAYGFTPKVHALDEVVRRPGRESVVASALWRFRADDHTAI